MTELTPNRQAADIIAALEAETMRVERAECAEAGMPASDHPVVQRAARVLDAARTRNTVTAAHLAIMTALEHLTADDLRARLVRDIQARTIRAAARAATFDEDGIPWGHEWHREGVAAWLDGIADGIETEGDQP